MTSISFFVKLNDIKLLQLLLVVECESESDVSFSNKPNFYLKKNQVFRFLLICLTILMLRYKI